MRRAPDAAGTIAIAGTASLAAGTYSVWYLHNDGYTALAGPITISIA
jgi:hypothetical protein